MEIIGWGETSTGGQASGVPFSVNLDFVTNTACTVPPFQWADADITGNMMHAFAPRTDFCGGDAGMCCLLHNIM